METALRKAENNQVVAVNDLSGPEKAAIIISLLGPENASPVVKLIEDHNLKAFIEALEGIRLIPREKMLSAVADFITELNKRKGGFRGGRSAAEGLAKNLLQDRADRIFGSPQVSNAGDSSSELIWSELKARETKDIVKYLGTQNSAVAGLILSKLPSEKAGEVLADLNEDMSVKCVSQMSRDKTPEPRVLDAIAELVKQEFLNKKNEVDSNASISFVSEILGILPRERREKMLESLNETDPEQVSKIKKAMMTFEDLPDRLPTSAVPIIFKDFEQEKLISALKAGGFVEASVVDFLLANISQRMAEQYKEQVEESPELSQKGMETAISTLMSFINMLEKSGRIAFIKVKPEEGEAA